MSYGSGSLCTSTLIECEVNPLLLLYDTSQNDSVLSALVDYGRKPSHKETLAALADYSTRGREITGKTKNLHAVCVVHLN